jgi:hypothetical protein
MSRCGAVEKLSGYAKSTSSINLCSTEWSLYTITAYKWQTLYASITLYFGSRQVHEPTTRLFYNLNILGK